MEDTGGKWVLSLCLEQNTTTEKGTFVDEGRDSEVKTRKGVLIDERKAKLEVFVQNIVCYGKL